jgi:hypothetical protein
MANLGNSLYWLKSYLSGQILAKFHQIKKHWWQASLADLLFTSDISPKNFFLKINAILKVFSHQKKEKMQNSPDSHMWL